MARILTGFRITLLRAAALTAAAAALWLIGPLWLDEWEMPASAEALRSNGWGAMFLINLFWVIWLVERRAAADRRRSARADRRNTPSAMGWVAGRTEVARRVWNPLDPAAWYYGGTSQRLRQSFAALAIYTLAFVAVWVWCHMSSAEVNPYDSPAGGGGGEVRPQQVRVQRTKQKKFVVSRYSPIKFNHRAVDDIKFEFEKETEHRYDVKQTGEGTGGSGGRGNKSGFGFGSGNKDGKVRFIRLKHSDRHWADHMGVGGDLNMLHRFRDETGIKIDDKTEFVEVAQLLRFPDKRSPPLIYLTGQEGMNFTAAEEKALRTYLVERHGMILADNCGGQGFHNSVIAAMNRITGVTAVPVPLDDTIHNLKFSIPFVPIVVAHGGTKAFGWKVDGRWVGYYHPGALLHAWRDGHSGIRRDVWEACFQLGINVIMYAHVEYDKWLNP